MTVRYNENLKGIEGVRLSANKAVMKVLFAADKLSVNSIDNPKNIYPVERSLNVKGKTVSVVLAPLSMNVLKLPCTLKNEL